MLFIICRNRSIVGPRYKIVQRHYPSRSAALDSLINYDFTYAEWCGSELKSSDLSGH